MTTCGRTIILLLGVLCLGAPSAGAAWQYDLAPNSAWWNRCPTVVPVQTSGSGVFSAQCTQRSEGEKVTDEYTASICVQGGVLDADWRSWVVSDSLDAAGEAMLDELAQIGPRAVWVTVLQSGQRRPLLDTYPLCSELQGADLSDWSGCPHLFRDGVLYVLDASAREVTFSFKLAMAVAGCDSWNDGGGAGDSVITIRCWLADDGAP